MSTPVWRHLSRISDLVLTLERTTQGCHHLSTFQNKKKNTKMKISKNEWPPSCKRRLDSRSCCLFYPNSFGTDDCPLLRFPSAGRPSKFSFSLPHLRDIKVLREFLFCPFVWSILRETHHDRRISFDLHSTIFSVHIQRTTYHYRKKRAEKRAPMMSSCPADPPFKSFHSQAGFSIFQ